MKIDYHEVVIKTFRLPDDNLATRATFLAENTRAAGVIALTADNKVIVGHQFRPGPEKMMIEIPGGGVDEGAGRSRLIPPETLRQRVFAITTTRCLWLLLVCRAGFPAEGLLVDIRVGA